MRISFDVDVSRFDVDDGWVDRINMWYVERVDPLNDPLHVIRRLPAHPDTRPSWSDAVEIDLHLDTFEEHDNGWYYIQGSYPDHEREEDALVDAHFRLIKEQGVTGWTPSDDAPSATNKTPTTEET